MGFSGYGGASGFAIADRRERGAALASGSFFGHEREAWDAGSRQGIKEYPETIYHLRSGSKPKPLGILCT
jgi:hypothetical protein